MFCFHIDADQSFFYGGQHVFNPKVLVAYRRTVDHKDQGPALQKLLDKLASACLRLMEEPKYKRVPQAFPAEHPRAGLLRQAARG